MCLWVCVCVCTWQYKYLKCAFSHLSCCCFVFFSSFRQFSSEKCLWHAVRCVTLPALGKHGVHLFANAVDGWLGAGLVSALPPPPLLLESIPLLSSSSQLWIYYCYYYYHLEWLLLFVAKGHKQTLKCFKLQNNPLSFQKSHK